MLSSLSSSAQLAWYLRRSNHDVFLVGMVREREEDKGRERREERYTFSSMPWGRTVSYIKRDSNLAHGSLHIIAWSWRVTCTTSLSIVNNTNEDISGYVMICHYRGESIVGYAEQRTVLVLVRWYVHSPASRGYNFSKYAWYLSFSCPSSFSFSFFLLSRLAKVRKEGTKRGERGNL